MPVLDTHPAPPPSDLVRAAQARLLARLDVPSAAGEDELEPVLAPLAGDATRYEFGEPFAAGGLGVIRRAHDRRLGRTVAVKELRRSDPDAERRFLLEAAITARLQHPAIVPIHDLGRFPTGEPYYCMKLVEGRSLEEVIRERTSLKVRLPLIEHVLAATNAVAYAHHHGVIHRDLKPANILVGEHGETVVIDWGLAKDTSGQISEELRTDSAHGDADVRATLTHVGVIVGTLRYMPPEQARGELVDARSDVFALGAVLFHVIAGRPPHEGIERAVLFRCLLEDKVEDLRPLVPDAPRELVAIVHKAMSPRPDDRYPGADALADDLRRFLAGRLVGAHHYQPGELLRLWLRRHRAAVAVATVALVALTASSLVFVSSLRSERDLAEGARRSAETAEVEALRREDEAVLAQARATLDDDLDGALRLLSQIDVSDDEHLRHARLVALVADARGAPDRVLRGHTRVIEQIAPLADGGLVSIDVAGEVWRWDVESREGQPVADLGAPQGILLAAAEAPVWVALAAKHGLIFRGDEVPEPLDLGPLDVRRLPSTSEHRWDLSRHGETLAALGTNGHIGSRRLAAAYSWELVARPALHRIAPFDHVHTAALSPDGAVIAITGSDRLALLLEGDRVTPIPSLRTPWRFSPSGRYLFGNGVWSTTDGSVRPFEGSIVAVTPDDHALVHELNPDIPVRVQRPRFALRSLATGETRWTADLDETREMTHALWGHQGGFTVADRGDRFALLIGDRWQIWSMATGKIERILEVGPHRRGVFLADGRFAVARHADVWVWDPSSLDAEPRYEAHALARDGSHAIIAQKGTPRYQRRDLAAGHSTPVACLDGLSFQDMTGDSGGRLAIDRRGRVLRIEGQGKACLSSTADAAQALELPVRATAVALAEGSDGFAVGCEDGVILAWSGVLAEPRRWQLGAPIASLWLADDGSALIAQTRLGQVFGLRAPEDSPRLLGTFMDENGMGPAVQVALHPQRAVFAVTLPGDDALTVYDAPRNAVKRRPLQLSTPPTVAYSPTGNRVAVGGAGRILLVFSESDVPDRELALPEDARSVAFLNEDELAVLGKLGSLIRVDLTIDAAVVLRREWSRSPEGLVSLAVAPTGELRAFINYALQAPPVDSVPRGRDEFRAWLSVRAQ